MRVSRKQHMQRPWSWTMPGVWEEQPGGLCVWSRVSEGGEGGGESRDGLGASRVGPCGPRVGLLTKKGVRWEPWRTVGRGGTGPD